NADAALIQNNSVTLDAGSDIQASGNVSLNAFKGNKTIIGKGTGTDLYREVAGAIASAVSGGAVSLEITGGSTMVGQSAVVVINGSIAVSRENRAYLTIDAAGNPTTFIDADGTHANTVT